MSQLSLTQQVELNNRREESDSKAVFGFWVYLMTDCVLFASLFAVYAVLHKNTVGGEPGSALFSLPYVLTETMILLTSSFTCGLAMLSAHQGLKNRVIGWFTVTGLLGVAFLTMELTEFSHLVRDGNSWHRSGFLSSYFTLVGTHGLHITIGLLWMILILVQVARKGLTPSNMKRLTLLSMFWHFLDLIWIFIFTVVYLSGVLNV
jgi:cytochrome o ubiquinol oxidase subunit 3